MKAFASFVPTNFRAEPSQSTVATAIAVARPIDFTMSIHHAARDREALADRTISRRVITLRDIFVSKRLGWSEPDGEDVHREGDMSSSSFEDDNRAPMHRLDRLQEVANLALENRAGKGETWTCADIGTDHGLLAICLHANGANVIAVDRADGPLEVARQNVGAYLRHAKQATGTAYEMRASSPRDPVDHAAQESGKEMREGVLRMECRLGNGLSSLEEGEVDTVCIAGVGLKTMVKILDRSDGSSNDDQGTETRGSGRSQSPLDLTGLGVRRLVLQPMDARLDYVRRLRVWLRENNWEITQETIVATPGKGGRHAFITIRADWSNGGRTDDRESPPAATVFPDWTGGLQQQYDWLGRFLPARATDPRRQMQGTEGGEENRREAEIFLAYLRHQRNWLCAIERIRSENEGDTGEGKHIALGVNGVLLAVDEAIQVANGGSSDVLRVNDADGLAQARKWRMNGG